MQCRNHLEARIIDGIGTHQRLCHVNEDIIIIIHTDADTVADTTPYHSNSDKQQQQ